MDNRTDAQKHRDEYYLMMQSRFNYEVKKQVHEAEHRVALYCIKITAMLTAIIVLLAMLFQVSA